MRYVFAVLSGLSATFTLADYERAARQPEAIAITSCKPAYGDQPVSACAMVGPNAKVSSYLAGAHHRTMRFPDTTSRPF